jgi:hypothetical protein
MQTSTGIEKTETKFHTLDFSHNCLLHTVQHPVRLLHKVLALDNEILHLTASLRTATQVLVHILICSECVLPCTQSTGVPGTRSTIVCILQYTSYVGVSTPSTVPCSPSDSKVLRVQCTCIPQSEQYTYCARL